MKFTNEIIDIVKCDLREIEKQNIKKITRFDDELKIQFESKLRIVTFITKTKLNVRGSNCNYILHI